MMQLKITLCDSTPLIWRRVRVPQTSTFAQLHRILQTLFGWSNSHLHAFHVGAPYGSPKIPARKTLSAYFTQPKQTAMYLYDFGDSWEHLITCEAIDAEQTPVKNVRCLDGANAAPPDDCGGIIGYYELLNAVRNKRHPEHEELREWLGEGFDPAGFDIATVNKRLGRGRK